MIRLFRERLGLPIADGYGQTETGAISGMRPGDDDPSHDGSMGRPLPGIETRIVEGELQLKPASSPTFFDRYLDGADPVAGEWWQTGDRVRQDGDGYLWFEGRGDDLILSSGYRIGPFEVESALVSHPAVAEAAAVAAPDPERGSVVRAIVVLRDDAGPSERLAAELQEHVKSQTAPYKYPRIVEFAAELPKTNSGKIRRAELRELGPATPRPPPRKKGKGSPKATPQPTTPTPTPAPRAASDWPPPVGTYEDTSKGIVMVISAGGTQASVALQGNDTCIGALFQTPPAAATATDTSFVSGASISLFGGNGAMKWDLEVVRGPRYTLKVDSSHHFPEQEPCDKPGVVIQGAFDKFE